MELTLILIPALLFAGAALNGAIAVMRLKGREVTDRTVSAIGIAAPVGAFFCALNVFFGLDGLPGSEVETSVFRWFSAGNLGIDLSLGADHLTCVMLLVVTGIGSLIHIYSTGYMKGDGGYARYFSFLNLFMAFMTVLVLGSNLVVMFVGWEGVGLCSYLLIGFWWKDPEKATAGMKAFVVNRIGDAAFLIGMFYLFSLTGTLDFGELEEWFKDPANREAALGSTAFLGAAAVTIIGLLLFVGATGKSAQIPLYVWLPDAMAGPTPVSALIHAATMVTAGVYLIARMNFLYALSPVAQGVIMVIGGATCLFAGIMGLVQFDIKKVLAYSTISQIGYMFIGVGTGHINTGIFHLTTHAFFKACLFLGAGSVIAMCHHEQDLRKMGGLGRRMPWTCAVMAVSAAAMAGVPPLSGFFSKDEVLWRAFSSGTMAGKAAWVLGFVCAGLTAFYMFRLIFLCFTGEYRGDHPPKEAPRSMVMPKQVLALGAVVVGFLGVPHILGGHDAFGGYVNAIMPEYARPTEAAHDAATVTLEWTLMIWSVVIGLIGIGAAWWCYIRKPHIPAKIADSVPAAYALVRDNFRVDEAYSSVIVKPVERASKSVLYDGVDQGFIEGIINGLARLFRGLSGVFSLAQGGVVRGYVTLMVVGTLLLMLLTMLK